jgi:hypothetical protein
VRHAQFFISSLVVGLQACTRTCLSCAKRHPEQLTVGISTIFFLNITCIYFVGAVG